MLHTFLTTNREELIKRCRQKVAKRPSPTPTDAELQFGIPLFLEQLTKTLVLEQTAGNGSKHEQPIKSPAPTEIGLSAAKHGNELLRKGFTVDQVVHDYGDLCQAVTELAVEQTVPITTDEFHTLNRCLDNAIADAVTEFGHQRDQVTSAQAAQATNERLGCLAHELRNLLNAAMLAVEAIKSGRVGISGATGAVLDRSLAGLRALVDRSLAEVRLEAEPLAKKERISVVQFLDEIQIFAAMEAKRSGLVLTVEPVEAGLAVEADRQMLSSATANLLQNAFKFTHREGHVSLAAHADGNRILIEIADECGGLPKGKAEELFNPFQQSGGDRTGLGLGLSISRRGVEANGGTLQVRNLPGKGCVFTIDLPRVPPAASA